MRSDAVAPKPRPQPQRPAFVPSKLEEHVVTLTSPASMEADQYRLLRWEIEHLRNTRNVAIVAVTSPAIGDGKTTTALNVAGVLSHDRSKRVLLVDADLRRPAASQRLGLSASHEGPGLIGLLCDSALPLESAVRGVPPFGLSVLPAGRLQGIPFELLRSPRLGELLGRARERYDLVVVDTPPLLLLPDCKALAQWVDGFLLVVAAHRTPRRLVEAALSALPEEKTLGLVLNQADEPRMSYYKDYYRSHARDGKGRKPGDAGAGL